MRVNVQERVAEMQMWWLLQSPERTQLQCMPFETLLKLLRPANSWHDTVKVNRTDILPSFRCFAAQSAVKRCLLSWRGCSGSLDQLPFPMQALLLWASGDTQERTMQLFDWCSDRLACQPTGCICPFTPKVVLEVVRSYHQLQHASSFES